MQERYHDDMTMDEIMQRWPATVHVALRHGLLCIGCPIASFHTVDDAIHEHGLDEETFRRDLLAAIEEPARELVLVQSPLGQQ
jgi:hybrid cluster-associated redox disulfide protein